MTNNTETSSQQITGDATTSAPRITDFDSTIAPQITGGIDALVFQGHWPWHRVPGEDLATIQNNLRRAGCSQAVVASLNSAFYRDAMDGNLDLMDALREVEPGFFLPAAVINPAYPGWERSARDCHEAGFIALVLYPQYHRYDASLPELTALLTLAAEWGWPVYLPARLSDRRGTAWMDFPDVLSHDQIISFLSLRHDVNWIVCAADNIIGLAQRWTDSLAKRDPDVDSASDSTPDSTASDSADVNVTTVTDSVAAVKPTPTGQVYFDISRLEASPFSKGYATLVAACGIENIVQAGFLPLRCSGVQQIGLSISGLTVEEQRAIAGENLRRILPL